MATNHLVRQGECLSSIATQYGFAEWRTIYDHPRNAELRRLRPNPNIIHPGDTVFIPDRQEKKAACTTGRVHEFEVHLADVMLRLVFVDDEEKPLAGRRYELKAGGRTHTGKTSSKGRIEIRIPARENAGELSLWLEDAGAERPGAVYGLRIGNLDPGTETSGVQGRLNNLGFDPGPVDGLENPRTRAAIRSFQMRCGLKDSGVMDEATRDRLRNMHDEE
jgi:hypothetical protein